MIPIIGRTNERYPDDLAATMRRQIADGVDRVLAAGNDLYAHRLGLIQQGVKAGKVAIFKRPT